MRGCRQAESTVSSGERGKGDSGGGYLDVPIGYGILRDPWMIFRDLKIIWSAINCMTGWYGTCIRGRSSLMRNGRMWPKKQRHLTPMDDPSQRGDYWDANSLDPQSKLLVSLVPGHRTTRTIHQVVADAAERLAAKAELPALVYRWRTDLSRSDCSYLWSSLSRAASRPPRPTPGPTGADPPSAGVCPGFQTSARGADPTGGSPTDLWQGQIGSSRGRLGLDESQHQRHRAVQPDRSDAQRTKGCAKRCAFRVGRIGMMPSVGLVLCATIFIIRIGHCDSGRKKADGNTGVRRWPPASPIISIPQLELMRLCPVGLR